jgi:hypothetical protein
MALQGCGGSIQIRHKRAGKPRTDWAGFKTVRFRSAGVLTPSAFLLLLGKTIKHSAQTRFGVLTVESSAPTAWRSTFAVVGMIRDLGRIVTLDRRIRQLCAEGVTAKDPEAVRRIMPWYDPLPTGRAAFRTPAAYPSSAPQIPPCRIGYTLLLASCRDEPSDAPAVLKDRAGSFRVDDCRYQMAVRLGNAPGQPVRSSG